MTIDPCLFTLYEPSYSVLSYYNFVRVATVRRVSLRTFPFPSCVGRWLSLFVVASVSDDVISGRRENGFGMKKSYIYSSPFVVSRADLVISLSIYDFDRRPPDDNVRKTLLRRIILLYCIKCVFAVRVRVQIITLEIGVPNTLVIGQMFSFLPRRVFDGAPHCCGSTTSERSVKILKKSSSFIWCTYSTV